MCFTLQVDKVVELRHPKSQPDIGEIRKKMTFLIGISYIVYKMMNTLLTFWETLQMFDWL